MSNKEFIDGLRVKAPHEKAPDFVKCKISIERKVLGNWLRAKDDDWINIDVKVSHDGKWYAEVNHWQPNQSGQQSGQPAPQSAHDQAESNGYALDDDDDIPF